MESQYLIFGCKGQLGDEFMRRLGDSARGFDLPDGDITNALELSDLFEALKPRGVINAAAYTKVDAAEEQPAICRKINAFGPGNLARLCRHYDIPLVHFSTDYVFCGTQKREPLNETDPVFPEGVYAKTKYEGELKAAECPKHLILRTCGLYGRLGENTPGNFVETMKRLGASGRPLKIVADQHCTPTYIPHLVTAALFLLESGKWGLYHVVNSGATTWYDFAMEIFRLEGLTVHADTITTEEWNAPAPRPLYSVLDTSKYHATGAPAMPSWQDALAEYLGKNQQ